MRAVCSSFLSLILSCPGAAAWAQDPVRLAEVFLPGQEYHVSSRVELSGSLTVSSSVADKNAKPTTSPLSVGGSSTIEYDERVLALDAGQVQRTLRLYRRMDFRRQAGSQLQEASLRPEVRRMVLLRQGKTEVPFSPDGPLMWSEIDRVRTDVFTPALAGLLPGREVRVGETWQAQPIAVEELTDLEELKEGGLECKLVELAQRGGRHFAQVSFSGSVRGLNQDGPNRQQLKGYVYYDIQAAHISYLYLEGTSWLLDKNGGNVGRLDGKYVLTRRPALDVPEFREQSLRALDLEPGDRNTPLLFREPALGVEFIYPRRWTVRSADARQITLEEPSGGGILITLEPVQQTPTGRQFQNEVAESLKKQAVRVQTWEPVTRTGIGHGDLEHFACQAEADRQRLFLDYYVVRQAAGGATFAGRFPIREAAGLQKDLERIASSLLLTPPTKK